MRRSTIPPMVRFTHKKSDGCLSVEISRDWMREFYDYEELGAIEDLKALVDRDQEVCPVTDFVEGVAVDFCQVCNHEVYEDDSCEMMPYECPVIRQHYVKGVL